MDFFDNPHFRLNKNLLCCLGLWPYDSQKKIKQICFFIFFFLLMLSHAAAIVIDFPDMDKVMEHLFNVLVITQVFLKYITFAFAENKMKLLYNDIANIWLIIVDEEEKRILLKYSNKGRILSLSYIALLGVTVASFFLVPLVPEILNLIDPLPVPRPHLFMLNSAFLHKNKNDHFYEIYIWDTMSVIGVIVIFMGIDPMYTVTVEQATALYAIITYRLSKLQGRVLNDLQDATDTSYEWLVHIIELHQTVLSFASNINDSYSTCFFCLSIMNILVLPLTCVVSMVYWHNILIFIRYALAIISLLIHVFALFWPGQKLIDHSTKLLDDAYCNDWYETPAKTKKLLRIFMLRCSEPCQITAGGLVQMNFEVYAKIVKTAASYVTVLASYR